MPQGVYLDDLVFSYFFILEEKIECLYYKLPLIEKKVKELCYLTYEEVLIQLGCVDEESPATINIYTSTFENKDLIADGIKEYNKSVDENKQIEYTDYMALLMSGITTIINAITYVLIAFVAISLVVSSIMIGVITLISVQERTKEIGILRAIGASKKDISMSYSTATFCLLKLI